MQAIWLASKDYASDQTKYFGTMIKKTLYHVYYPLLNILHEWYRLKYHSAQAVVNQAT